jgi:hypothetical protein
MHSVFVFDISMHLSLQHPACTACERGERCQGAVLSIREKGLATSGTGCWLKHDCSVAALPLLMGLLRNGGSRACGIGASSSLDTLSDTHVGCQDRLPGHHSCVSAAATPGTKGKGIPYAHTTQSNSNKSPNDRAPVRRCGPCKAGLTVKILWRDYQFAKTSTLREKPCAEREGMRSRRRSV